ncbi:hypothetical protein JOD17_003097 [Geomicrobium sediminis]|uniref:Uncharacterized protein n=1 Tax=Geomicrobium sediminis TaxID=1347788 RepID=A0ABS2PEZ2_9BACL|nr:hypothetical protein [Geomicrobium sediminis]
MHNEKCEINVSEHVGKPYALVGHVVWSGGSHESGYHYLLRIKKSGVLNGPLYL